jgi:hypothetical protein
MLLRNLKVYSFVATLAKVSFALASDTAAGESPVLNSTLSIKTVATYDAPNDARWNSAAHWQSASECLHPGQ